MNNTSDLERKVAQLEAEIATKNRQISESEMRGSRGHITTGTSQVVYSSQQPTTYTPTQPITYTTAQNVISNQIISSREGERVVYSSNQPQTYISSREDNRVVYTTSQPNTAYLQYVQSNQPTTTNVQYVQSSNYVPPTQTSVQQVQYTSYNYPTNVEYRTSEQVQYVQPTTQYVNTQVFQPPTNYDSRVILGYWGIRGRAQPLRFMMEYAGISYEDKQYTDQNVWFKSDKPQLATNFPNGNITVTETIAIASYIVDRFGLSQLAGDSPQERALSSTIVHICMVCGDVSTSLAEMLFASKDDWEKKRVEKFKAKILPKLQNMEKQLDKNRKFLLGDQPRVCDFFAYELLSMLYRIFTQEFANFWRIMAFLNNFEDLPRIKDYMNSGRVPKLYMPQGAHWSH